MWHCEKTVLLHPYIPNIFSNKPHCEQIWVLTGSLTKQNRTVEMISNIIVCFHFVSGSKSSFLMAKPESVKVETPQLNGAPRSTPAHPNKVGGFPLGAANPAARQILYGSFDLAVVLVYMAQTGLTALFCLPAQCYFTRTPPPHPTPIWLCQKEKNLVWKHNPLFVRTLSW